MLEARTSFRQNCLNYSTERSHNSLNSYFNRTSNWALLKERK